MEHEAPSIGGYSRMSSRMSGRGQGNYYGNDEGHGGGYPGMAQDMNLEYMDDDHLAHHDRAWGSTAWAGDPIILWMTRNMALTLTINPNS